MSKKKIIGLLWGTLLLTSCGNGESAAETAKTAGNISETSEIISETRETVSETEIPETSETTAQEETESTENFDKVKDRVIFEDGENVLTAGQYIDALLQCSDFTELYKNGIQLADLNGDGIPETSARIAIFPITVYFSVSADGKATMLYDENGENEICAELPKPYKSEGKTVWLADFYDGGSGGGGGGDCIVKRNGNTIGTEIIRNYSYHKDPNTFEYYYTYYWGSDEVSEEEYENRYEAFLAEMQPSEARYSVDRVYGGYTYNYYELTELLAGMMKEYLGL